MFAAAVRARSRRLRRWLLLACLSGGAGLTSWLGGCTSFSGSSGDTVVDIDGAADMGASNADGTASGDTGIMGMPSDGGQADADIRGCAEVEASACFDFDHVMAAAIGWSSANYVGASEPTLSDGGYSAPNSARFELPAEGGPARPIAMLQYPASPSPASIQARLLVPSGAAASAIVVTYDLKTTFGGNAVDLAYACGQNMTTCTATVTVYSQATIDAGFEKTDLDCGIFARDEWTLLTLSVAPSMAGQMVTCSVDGQPHTVGSGTPIDFGPSSGPLWNVGAFDQNLPSYGGEVVYLDDVILR